VTDLALLKRLKIEPLDRNTHDRAAFSCGNDKIDNFLKINAAGQQDQDITKAYVIVEPPSPRVLGFYAMNAHSIDATVVPEALRKKLPKYPNFSAVYISVIGTQKDLQGKGIGSILLADALKRCIEIADKAGSFAVVLDALNDDAARLYRKIGFIDIPSEQHDRRMMISMQAVRKSYATA
jgi:ribosomal protein S18 acetylase RimI-like enzyme